MFAIGAIACDVSTSSATSSAQALLSSWCVPFPGCGFVAGEPLIASSLNFGIPAAHVTPSSPHIGWRLNAWLNTCRSCAIVSLPYESTMAIVMPLPSQPALYSGPTLYADWIACGVKHVLPTASQSASVGVVVLMNWKSVTAGCGTGYAACAFPEPVKDPARAARPASTPASATAMSSLRFIGLSPSEFSPSAEFCGLVGRVEKADRACRNNRVGRGRRLPITARTAPGA